MSIIIKLQGLPLEATSVDVRRYFLGLTIPDGGVHIVGGDDGTVFIEFASDEDARQAMARGDGNIKNSTIKLLLSSRTEMQSVIEAARKQQQQYLQQYHQPLPTTLTPQQQQPQPPQQQPHPPQQHPPQPQLQQLQQLQQHQHQHQQQQQHQHQQQQQHHPQHHHQPHQQPQQQPQPSPFIDPRILSQNYQSIMQPSLTQNAPLLPQHNQIFNQFTPTTYANCNSGGMALGLLGSVGGLVGTGGGGGAGVASNVVVTSVTTVPGDMNMIPGSLVGNAPSVVTTTAAGASALGNVGQLGNFILPNSLTGGGIVDSDNISNNNGNNNVAISNNSRNQSPDNRARMSGMRGGDDKLFANKRCVLAASNIPYRATSKDIIEFLSEFNIKEDCIRRRYNQKGQPTADAKIAFPTPDAAIKAMKMMNKKTLCGRPVFLKPV